MRQKIKMPLTENVFEIISDIWKLKDILYNRTSSLIIIKFIFPIMKTTTLPLLGYLSAFDGIFMHPHTCNYILLDKKCITQYITPVWFRYSLCSTPVYSVCTDMWIMVFYWPDIANPLKPTASTRKEMATPLLWEYPTTSSNVASMPNPNRARQQVTHMHTQAFGHHSVNWIKHDTLSAPDYISDRYEINVTTGESTCVPCKHGMHRFSPKHKLKQFENPFGSNEQQKNREVWIHCHESNTQYLYRERCENENLSLAQASHLHSSWFSWQW